MADSCCSAGPSKEPAPTSARVRRTLWIALLVNAVMFVVELSAGWRAGSVSLLADAIDFLGDAANYGVSLYVLSLAVVWRSRTALLKGLMMGGYGIFVLAQTVWAVVHSALPDAKTMGVIGVLALIANVAVAVMLYAYREGDANMRSVWLCSRNDAIGNVAVLIAAGGVFATQTAWPDLSVAVIMAVLGLTAARAAIRQALGELQSGRDAPHAG